MKRLLYILCLCLLFISCERRELIDNYNPTVDIAIDVDWSNMSAVPSGMSVYCYPVSGDAPTIAIANITSVQSSITVSLTAGIYNILVFNQIPSDFGTIGFSGMDSYDTASIGAISSTTLAALVSKNGDEYIREPEELAAATYLDLEVTQEAVTYSVELKSKGYTKSEELIWTTVSLVPEVVIKNTQVTVRVSGIYNYYSATARLYGMATGYNFAKQQSHSDMTSHLLEEWRSTTYEEDSREGEITITFTCFGLPGQNASSLVSDYAEWEGVMDLDITLVDQLTVISESIELCDKITTTSSSKADDDEQSDTEANLDMNIDIDISSGFGLTDGDDPIVLPDVTPAGSTGSAFDATVDDWGDEEIYDLLI